MALTLVHFGVGDLAEEAQLERDGVLTDSRPLDLRSQAAPFDLANEALR